MLRQLLLMIALVGCASAQTGDAPRSLETTPIVRAAESAPTPDLLNRMVGRWQLTGDLAGQSTVHDVEVVWVLQGNYVRITEVSRDIANGHPAYEAIVYVGWLRDHYVCLWLDNTEVASGAVTCAATPTGDTIPFEFRDAQGALIFTNAFVYNRAEDTWEWRLDNIRNGAATPFGRVTLRRP